MFEKCLLRVQAVLRLVPDRGALAVEHVLGDLLARMGGQAVQHDGVVARLRQQLGVDPVGREQLAPPLGVVPRRPCSPTRPCRWRARRAPPPRARRRAPPAARAPAARPRPPPRRRSARRSGASGSCCCRRPRRRASAPRACRSARAASSGRRAPGRGGAPAVSMLITGTDECSASSVTVSCGPVRMPIAWTMRESTSATSRGDSPRAIWSSPWRRISGCPPSSYTPVSNETRVRVDGLSNTSATLLPSSAREDRRSALSSIARSRSRRCSAVVSSSPVRKCLANASPQLESLPRARLSARQGALHAALAPAACDRAQRDARAGEPLAVPRVHGLARRPRVGRGAASGGAAALVPRVPAADGLRPARACSRRATSCRRCSASRPS